MMNESSVTDYSAVEYLDQLAGALAQREHALGGAVSDGPSSGELQELAETFSGVLQVEQDRFLTPHEIWATMKTVASVADKWKDPEADPVGREAWMFLEECIQLFGQELEEAVPESADEHRRWANLRTASHCLARDAWRQQRNPSLQTPFGAIMPVAIPTPDTTAFPATTAMHNS